MNNTATTAPAALTPRARFLTATIKATEDLFERYAASGITASQDRQNALARQRVALARELAR